MIQMMGIRNVSVLYDEWPYYQETGSLRNYGEWSNYEETGSFVSENNESNPCSEKLEDLDDNLEAQLKDADFDAEETEE